ncbi:C-C motif chemokine 20-like [Nelusetta ayraudi]|uniref:C-C motif chemokine 20-like n=1 Tax=Nelusetta ayraudi TaxID=303726 RepID=UPI003F723040
MSPRGVILGATLLCFLMGLLSPAQSARSGRSANACCRSYSRRRVPVNLIKGYREQTDTGICPIEAIIFLTTWKAQICASLKDEWVKKVLQKLSSKLNKMSKAGEGRLKKSVSSDGSGLFTPAKVFPNSTDSFY